VSVAGATGNGAAEAYTASLWGVGLSHVINEIAEAETVATVEGYMCGAAIARHRRSAGVEGHWNPGSPGPSAGWSPAGAGGEGQPEPTA
jgi:hypothetical protein